MKIAVLNRPGRFDLVDEPEPPVGPGDVLLRIAACGVCASELDIFQGRATAAPLPWYPGHEVSGAVEKAGEDVTGFAPGDPVAAWVTARGFAERIAVPADQCFPAGDVPLEQALGEPLACAVNAVDLAAPALGDDVVIVGAGFMGHLIHKLVLLRGPRHVIVADSRDDALERAQRIGATATVNVAKASLRQTVAEITGGAGADVTFEVTGVQPALDGLHELTRMSGTVVIAGYHQGDARRVPLGVWNWMAYRIVNAHFRDPATILRGMGMGMRLLTSGRLSLAGLVTHAVPLERIDEGFQIAIAKPPGFVKATVRPGGWRRAKGD
jgi:2-desacetyl-2-hydroxyethyl bacteriochlorophyllide A dehydrogenase